MSDEEETFIHTGSASGCQRIAGKMARAYGYNFTFPAARSFKISQGYNPQTGHLAYDYSFPRHSIVAAAKSGTVVDSLFTHADEWDSQCQGGVADRGNYIILEHDGGVRTKYYHLSNWGNQPGIGAEFEQGEYMALSDDTSCSSADHLHFFYLAD